VEKGKSWILLPKAEIVMLYQLADEPRARTRTIGAVFSKCLVEKGGIAGCVERGGSSKFEPLFLVKPVSPEDRTGQ
jgi:hypothetical protein